MQLNEVRRDTKYSYKINCAFLTEGDREKGAAYKGMILIKRNFQIEKSTKPLSRRAPINFERPCYWVQSL